MSGFYPVGNSHSNWGEGVSHGGLDSCFLGIGDAEPFPYAFWPLRYLILKNVSSDLLPIFESSCLVLGSCIFWLLSAYWMDSLPSHRLSLCCVASFSSFVAFCCLPFWCHIKTLTGILFQLIYCS